MEKKDIMVTVYDFPVTLILVINRRDCDIIIDEITEIAENAGCIKLEVRTRRAKYPGDGISAVQVTFMSNRERDDFCNLINNKHE